MLRAVSCGRRYDLPRVRVKDRGALLGAVPEGSRQRLTRAQRCIVDEVRRSPSVRRRCRSGNVHRYGSASQQRLQPDWSCPALVAGLRPAHYGSHDGGPTWGRPPRCQDERVTTVRGTNFGEACLLGADLTGVDLEDGNVGWCGSHRRPPDSSASSPAPRAVGSPSQLRKRRHPQRKALPSRPAVERVPVDSETGNAQLGVADVVVAQLVEGDRPVRGRLLLTLRAIRGRPGARPSRPCAATSSPHGRSSCTACRLAEERDERAATAGRAWTRLVALPDLAESCPVTGDLPLLGFGLPVSGSWATPDMMRRTARRAEELGYASLWTFQRVLYPADGELDPSYRAVHDPVVPLAYVAGHTDRIGLGTATVCAPFTAPALLAKTLTSLDVLSGGRLTVGLGIGWLPQEYAAAGCPSSGGARGWTSTCAACRRCGRRTRSSSPASSTRCRARTWARRPCSDRTHRCCSAAPLRRHCAAPGGSPRAGSAAAGRTSPGSARASRRCATARARLGATRRPCGSSCAASSTSSTTTPAGSAGHSRGRASRCSTTSLHSRAGRHRGLLRPQLLAPGRLPRRRRRRGTRIRGARARRVRARERVEVARGRREVPVG